MIATYTSPSARSASGSSVITRFAASIVAVKAIAVPFSSSVLSVSSEPRSVFASAVPEASLWIASAKLSVMFPVASVSVPPSAG